VRHPSHHQELKTALTVSGFTLKRGGSSAVGRGLPVTDKHKVLQILSVCL
jgi:hypothetical protein